MDGIDKILFDTDILIDHLRNVGSATAFLRETTTAKTKPRLSIISRIELLSGSKISEGEETIIREMFKLFEIILLDEFIADLAANFRRKYACGIGDSIIAATAYKEGAVLVSRNLKHFNRIKEIEVFSPYNLPVKPRVKSA